MRIAYHFTALPPAMPESVAELQEINALRSHFGGSLHYVNPNQTSLVYLPRVFFGLQQLRSLLSLESTLDLHHFYNADAYPFPILRLLRKPVVYTISGGVRRCRLPRRFLNSMATVIVYDERSLARMREKGIQTGVVMRPGIDTAKFSHHPISLTSPIRFMYASAPWTLAQFQNKGVDALLKAAQLEKELELVFLWRGVMADEMRARIAEYGVQDQVTLITDLVDVNQILAKVHGTIALADQEGIIKAYPHSLLDSLAAGKPVVASRGIPMAEYIEKTGVGCVIESVEHHAILRMLDEFRDTYSQLQLSAQQIDLNEFSVDSMLRSYRELYLRSTRNHKTHDKEFY